MDANIVKLDNVFLGVQFAEYKGKVIGGFYKGVWYAMFEIYENAQLHHVYHRYIVVAHAKGAP
jgi:hypothetical protein